MTSILLALALVAGASTQTESWVLVRDSRTTSMHGDMEDLRVAKHHLRELGPGYLWFRRGGKAYVVKDGKVVDAIEEALKPQEELGEEQSRLGEQQSRLGEQQSKLGERQSALGARQAQVAMRRAQRELNGERPPRDRESEQELAETQRELSKAQQALGREQQKMGREQQKLGDQQRELSRKVERRVDELIAASLRDGTARPVQD
jgi:hypothetical protein